MILLRWIDNRTEGVIIMGTGGDLPNQRKSVTGCKWDNPAEAMTGLNSYGLALIRCAGWWPRRAQNRKALPTRCPQTQLI